MATPDFNALLENSKIDDLGRINVSGWGQEFGKRWAKFIENGQTQKLISASLSKYKVPEKDFIKIKKGKGSSIYVHVVVAVAYAEWLDPNFSVHVKETFLRVAEGDSDLAADMMIRDHNKGRVERAKNRVLCSETNKQTAAIAQMAGLPVGKVHNDRYNGLYRKTAAQLRTMSGLKHSETPLDVMSSRDLQMNGLANTLSLEAGNADLLFDFANDIKESYEKRMGKPLVPIFEENLLRPQQARAIAYAPEYQGELPV